MTIMYHKPLRSRALPLASLIFIIILINGCIQTDSDVAYCEMGMHRDKGFPITIDSVGVPVNITGQNSTVCYRVGFPDNKSMIINLTGNYSIAYDVSFSGGNNNKYQFSVTVNGTLHSMGHAHRKTGSNDVGNAGANAIFKLGAGAQLNFVAIDEMAPVASIVIISNNFVIERLDGIGELGDDMEILNLLIYLILTAVGLVLIGFMHAFKEDEGSSVAFGFFGGTILMILGLFLVRGFEAFPVIGVPFNVNPPLGMISLLFAFYGFWYSIGLFNHNRNIITRERERELKGER